MWVEAESSKIGELHVPTELWQAMKAAGGVELQVSVTERTAYLMGTYRHFVDHPDGLKSLILRLRHKLGDKVVNGWVERIDTGRWHEFVADVLAKHYDPAYRHSRERDFPHVGEALAVDSLSEASIHRLAKQLLGESIGVSRRCGLATGS